MKARRLKNKNLSLILDKKNLPEKELKEETVIASGIITSNNEDCFRGKEIQLIYDPKKKLLGNVDGTYITGYVNSPPIPIYISKKGLINLIKDKSCEDSFLGKRRVLIRAK